LIRRLVLCTLSYNIVFRAKHIARKSNISSWQVVSFPLSEGQTSCPLAESYPSGNTRTPADNLNSSDRKTALSNVFVKLLSIHLSIPSIIFSKIYFVIGRRASCDFRRLLHPVRNFFLTTKALDG
jgi:hypothetical protein